MRERQTRTYGTPSVSHTHPYALEMHMVIWFFIAANEHLPAGIIKLNAARRKQLNPSRINILHALPRPREGENRGSKARKVDFQDFFERKVFKHEYPTNTE
uniref:Uncharacterized protein n=1 Tax=Schizaphis graminum TaxID=13262 RepID=A0A2S2NP81_SCHGA